MATNAIAVPAREDSASATTRTSSAKEVQYEFVKMLRTKGVFAVGNRLPVMFYLLFGTSNRHNMFARYLMPSYSCMGVVSVPVRHRHGHCDGARLRLAGAEAGEPDAAAGPTSARRSSPAPRCAGDRRGTAHAGHYAGRCFP